jgi:mRNA-degrading endonuclease toxin of MazEF toxin-antitoxin module
MIRRGTVYRLEGSSRSLVGVLVLTNDVWNRRMRAVGVVPIRQPTEPDTIWTPHVGALAYQASVGFLANLPTDLLMETRLVLDQAETDKVAAGLADLLHLEGLCREPPDPPLSMVGSRRFPRWSEIYYAGRPVGAASQTKRYVIVSDERWNALGKGAIAVRTTTQSKSWGAAFPSIEEGRARACCGDATVFPSHQFDYDGRPNPASLLLADMVSIARGLCDVFDIDVI